VLKVTVFPGGHGTLLGVVSSFVHIIMYTYYLLAAHGPTVQKYLWWKKHLTSLQLVRHYCVCRAGYKTAYLLHRCVETYIGSILLRYKLLLSAEYWKIIQSNVFTSKQVPSIGSQLRVTEYSRNEQDNWCE